MVGLCLSVSARAWVGSHVRKARSMSGGHTSAYSLASSMRCQLWEFFSLYSMQDSDTGSGERAEAQRDSYKSSSFQALQATVFRDDFRHQHYALVCWLLHLVDMCNNQQEGSSYALSAFTSAWLAPVRRQCVSDARNPT